MVTRKSSSRKSAARKSATKAAIPASADSQNPDPANATEAGEAVAPPAPNGVKKKELFARVKARSGKVKGSDVRQVMDAVLEELGVLLVAGDTLNAQPLGTLKVQKHRTLSGADVVVCKLRRKKPAGGGKDPLAEAAE